MTKQNSREQLLRSLLLSYDGALAAGGQFDANAAALEFYDAPRPLDEETAEEFAELRECADLLEQLRRKRHVERAVADFQAQATALPQRIGRFQIRHEIGRGGGGIVFLAHDPRLDREIALKVPHPQGLVLPDLRQRFLREAQAVALLEHPHIVAVHEVGEDPPICYIASSYCDGPNLAQWLDRASEPLPIVTVVEIMQQVCGAVQYAHAHGVLHRDIKPSNILVTSRSDSSAGNAWTTDTIAKLTDFGLAKRFEDETEEVTRTGAVLGTPRYMAPEQVEARQGEIATQTDVWALGAVMYELITGSTPFAGQSDADTFQRILNEDPLPPHRMRPVVSQDLAAVCLKCLQKKPGGRYQNVHDLADDLRRFLAGEPTLARPISRREAAVRWLRRHPQATAFWLVVIVGIAISMVALAAHNASLSRLSKDLRGALTRAEQSDRQSRQLLYATDISAAADAWEDGDLRQFHDLMRRQLPPPGKADLRGFEWHYLWRRGRAAGVRVEQRQVGLWHATYAHNGRWLASVGKDDLIQFYDVQKQSLAHSISTKQMEVNKVLFSPDDRLVYTAGADGTIAWWDVRTGCQLRVVHAHDASVRALALSSDGGRLYSGGADALVRMWDTATGKALGAFRGHVLSVTTLAVTGDNRLLISASHDRTTRIWDLASGQEARQLVGHSLRVTALAASADGRYVVTGSADKDARVWEAATGRCLASFATADVIRSVAIAADGSSMAIGGSSGTIQILERARDQVDSLHRFEAPLYWCVYSSIGHSIVRATAAGLFVRDLKTDQDREIDLHNPELIAILANRRPSDTSQTFAVSTSGGMVAIGNEVHRIDAIDESASSLQCVLGIEPTRIERLKFAPADVPNPLDPALDNLLGVVVDGKTQVWNVSTGQLVSELADSSGHAAVSLDFLRHDGSLLTGRSDGRIRRWHTLSGASWDSYPKQLAELRHVLSTNLGDVHGGTGSARQLCLQSYPGSKPPKWFAGHTAGIRQIIASPDKALLASSSRDDTVRVWEIKTQRCLRVIQTSAVSISFAADGKQLLAAQRDGTARAWNIDDPHSTRLAAEHKFIGHDGRVQGLEFAPHDQQLTSAGSDGKLMTWPRQSQMVQLCTDREGVQCHDFAFLPDGQHVLLAEKGGAVYMADLATNNSGAHGTAIHQLGNANAESIVVWPAQNRLITLATDGLIQVHNHSEPDGHCPYEFARVGAKQSDGALFCSESGLLAVTDRRLGMLHLFDLRDGRRLKKAVASGCTTVAFSPDERFLVYDDDNRVIFHDVQSAQRTVLGGHTETVLAVAVSPDGQLIASSGRDQRLVLWDATTKRRLGSHIAHHAEIAALAFSCDGRSILIGARDGTLKVWHVATGQELAVLARLPGGIRKMGFSPTHDHIVCLSSSGRATVLHVGLVSPNTSVRQE